VSFPAVFFGGEREAFLKLHLSPPFLLTSLTMWSCGSCASHCSSAVECLEGAREELFLLRLSPPFSLTSFTMCRGRSWPSHCSLKVVSQKLPSVKRFVLAPRANGGSNSDALKVTAARRPAKPRMAEQKEGAKSRGQENGKDHISCPLFY